MPHCTAAHDLSAMGRLVPPVTTSRFFRKGKLRRATITVRLPVTSRRLRKENDARGRGRRCQARTGLTCFSQPSLRLLSIECQRPRRWSSVRPNAESPRTVVGGSEGNGPIHHREKRGASSSSKPTPVVRCFLGPPEPSTSDGHHASRLGDRLRGSHLDASRARLHDLRVEVNLIEALTPSLPCASGREGPPLRPTDRDRRSATRWRGRHALRARHDGIPRLRLARSEK